MSLKYIPCPDHMDDEANVFAAYLLMPEPMFEQAMQGVDLFDEHRVEKVARKFRVPVAAVHYRVHLAARLASTKPGEG